MDNIYNEINTLLFKLGNNYEMLNEYNESIYCYKKILKSLVKESEQVNLLRYRIATNYFKLRKYDKALDYLNKLISEDKMDSELYIMLVSCYVNLKNFNSALCILHNFKLIQKNNKDIDKMIGEIYYYLKEYDRSIEHYKKSNDKYALAPALLANKDFKLGFELYEDRLRTNDICHQTKLPLRQNIDLPNWDGKSVCKKLLVVYEQGIGDNIMYFRFLIELAKKFPSMKITYFCKDIVSHMLNGNSDNLLITHNTNDFNIPSFDYKCFIMSIPYILEKEEIEINEINYINVNNEKYEYWKKKIKSDRPKIGFFYKGLLISSIDKIIKIENLNKLFNLEADFICLHKKEEIKDDINFFSKNVKTFDIDKEKAFEDTIAILQNIDLLITIDSGITHLAGVMNIPTFLLLGYVSEWRWFNNNKKIWYNSVDIYHQIENKDILHDSEKIIEDIKEKLNL